MAVCMVSGRKRDVITLKHRLPQPKTGCAKHAYQGLFLGTFLVFFWQLLHTLTMSQRVTDIHGSSQILRVLEFVSFQRFEKGLFDCSGGLFELG